MTHYWGAKAILQRLGFSPKSYRIFPELIERHQLPCWPRRHGGWRWAYYSNDDMIVRWEMAHAKQSWERIVAERAGNVDRRYKCREREKKAVTA